MPSPDHLRVAEALGGRRNPATGRTSERTGQDPAGADPAEPTAPRAPTWPDVATSILTAGHATIIGIAPIPLIAALDDILWTRPESVRVAGIDYLTPHPTAIPDWGTDAPEITYQKNRWLAGYQGMLNITLHLGRTVEQYDGALAGCRFWFQDCLIRVAAADAVSFWQIGYLPTGPDPTESCCVAAPQPTAELDAYFTGVKREATGFRLWNISCSPTAPVEAIEPELPELNVKGLEEYHGGDYQAAQLWPIAAVIARYPTYDGPCVLLRRRNKLTDRDDFDRLSLPSSRVTADDLATSLRVPVAVHSLASDPILYSMSQAAGTPKARRLRLGEETFRVAVQRLILDQLGLHIDGARARFAGYTSLDREDARVQLGFALFILDLARTEDDTDELTRAMRRSGNSLELVPVAQLERHAGELNRLLKAHLIRLVDITMTQGG